MICVRAAQTDPDQKGFAKKEVFSMNTTLAQRQQAYARLLLQEGLNVQKGQLLAW